MTPEFLAERASKDRAYAERNKIVAALARLAPVLGGDAWLAPHREDPTWEADWRTIVFVVLPGCGQMTWHLHDSHVPDFSFLCRGLNLWDGHSTEEKYERLARLDLRNLRKLLAAGQTASDWAKHHKGMVCHFCAPRDGKHETWCPLADEPTGRNDMTKDEYERLYAANTLITGYGMETTMHVPCPFCAAPEFLIYRILDVNEALLTGAVCKACGRGMRGIVEEMPTGTHVRLIQTCGDDPPPWVVALPRETGR